MLRHYFNFIFRRVRKHFLISLLNIGGLAIGIACFIMIMLYVNHELHFDRFNEHFDDIYRVAVNARFANTSIQQTGTPAAMPRALIDEYPEVKAVTRIADWPQTVRTGNLVYNEEKAAAVDSSFADIFTLNFLEGTSSRVLTEPGQVLLDRTTARKYFGDGQASGRILYIQDTLQLTVAGVYEDFPAQSHFHFNVLISLLSLEGIYNNPAWFANDFDTYLRLEHGFPAEELEAKLPAFVDKYLFEGRYAEVSDPDNFWELYLQHIREIHLGSDLHGEFEPNGNLVYIRIFTLVAILLLLVACINFMNLTTASSAIRVREVGVRKTSGASRKKLRSQFFIEAIAVSFLALILAMCLVESLMAPYRDFTGRDIQITYLDNFLVIPGLLGLAVLVGLLSGSYPAVYMSRFSAVDALGFKGVSPARAWFRNLLVLFQFTVTVFLIGATLLVQKQTHLITEESLGFNKDQVILVHNAHYMDQLESYMDELMAVPEISQVALSTNVPGDMLINTGFELEGTEAGFGLNVNFVSDTYLETMEMEMASGRFFSKEYGADRDKIIINETTVKLLELEDPIGTRLYYNAGNRPMEVIGVIRDYHWESKHMKIRSHALIPLAARNKKPNYLSVRFEGRNAKKVIEILQGEWEERVSSVPFEYDMLDSHYEGIYQNEKQTQTLLRIFTLVAIFISCLGLFGLASFMAERRTKEIGIRKINGASTRSILRLLSLDFTRWVLLANLFAWPAIWLAMKRWLENFAYRTEILPWIYPVAGFTAFVIALATVSYHARRASRMNPALSLRYE
jgi:putative ABC transport system permease protein